MAKGLTTHVNKDIGTQIEERCKGLNCSKSEYLRNLVLRDLNGNDKQNNNTSSSSEAQVKPRVKNKIIIRKPVTVDHQAVEQPKLEPPKEDPHITLAKRLPRGINFAECRGCHTVIQNPHVTTKFKSCPHCSANTVPKDNKICPTCGKESESDEWDDSDVELEEHN